MKIKKNDMTSQKQTQLPEIHLRAPWLFSARIGWVLFSIVTLVLILGGIPERFNQLSEQYAADRSLIELDISAGSFAAYLIGLNLAITVAHSAIAAMLFWRKSDDWMALFVSFTLVSNGAILPLSALYSSSSTTPVSQTLINLVISTGLISSITLLYIFPNGQFVPKWTRPLAIPWILFAIVFPATAPTFLQWHPWLQIATIGMMLAWSGAGVIAQIYRFQNFSNHIQRQQTKWAVLGISAAVAGPFQYFLPFIIIPALGAADAPNIFYQRVGALFFTFSFLVEISGLTLFRVATLLFPLSFAIAILRYRLWDIDLLINRALVYGTLTGILALLYFTAVVTLQSVFRTFTGKLQSEIVTVISTLAIATLFTPLREHIQAGIDQRFYRKKYDAAKTLASFNASLRHEVDLAQLEQRLLSVVEETMQPTQVWLWFPAGAWLKRPTPSRSETIDSQGGEREYTI